MADFLNDTFAGTDGTDLSAHVGETGATWTEHASYATGLVVLSDANRVRSDAAAASVYYASGVPSNVNYDVYATLRVRSVTGSAGIGGRIQTAANSYYLLWYNGSSGAWELYETVAGSATLLGSFTQALTLGATYDVALRVTDTVKEAIVGGVVRISSTSNNIAGAGRAGVIFAGDTANTTGIHVASIRATNTPDATNLIACVGDSRTSGLYATNPALNYPGLLGATPRLSDYNVRPFGVSGDTIAEMTARVSSAWFAGSWFANKIAIVWGGINDHVEDARTAAQINARIATLVTSLRSAGATAVYVCTELPFEWAGWEAVRAALNPLIVANAAGADGIIRLDLIDGMGEVDDNTDETYYDDDHGHLVDAGFAKIAATIAEALSPASGLTASQVETLDAIGDLIEDGLLAVNVTAVNGVAVEPVGDISVNNGGAGADAVTLTFTSDGVAVPDADVWVTSDAGGQAVVAGTLQTDSNGHATFMLDAGATYYFWGQKDGVNAIRGQQFVAVAD